MVVGDTVASDNPPSIVVNLTVDRPSDVDSTVDPDVNIVYGNPSSNGVNSMIDAFVPTSNTYHQLAPLVSLPQQHIPSFVVYGTQSPPVFASPILSSSMVSSVPSSPQAHIAMPKTVVDNTCDVVGLSHVINSEAQRLPMFTVLVVSPLQQQMHASSSSQHDIPPPTSLASSLASPLHSSDQISEHNEGDLVGSMDFGTRTRSKKG
ncbi:hypothetical protein V6N12_067127 [Hibiscus sabdariffa]|uniref:Uncharacterized protein n=1 Tax=Hibiscus sabdariffa TaxID=183260 RepID=A0ABR2AW12_9ROSI